MAYSDRSIKRDRNNAAIPQVFDVDQDDFVPAIGTAGRQHTILYDASGNAVDVATLLADIAAIKAAAEATQAAVEGTLTTQVSGSNGELELQGPIAAIPAADSVPQNSIYFALDTGELLWTDGETWQPVGGGS